MARDYIPRTDAEFDEWLEKFSANINAIAAPLGISPALITAVITAYTNWDLAYDAHQLAQNAAQSAALTKDETRTLAKEAVRPVVGMLQKNPGLTDAQRATLAITVPDTEPTPRGKITDIPYVKLKAVGGGSIEVRCQVETDETRPSMHPLADGVECRYILVPVGEMPPEGHEDAKKTLVSKKALFTIKCGDKQAGQRFYGFFRWTNLTNPANSGDWSPAQTVMIA